VQPTVIHIVPLRGTDNGVGYALYIVVEELINEKKRHPPKER